MMLDSLQARVLDQDIQRLIHLKARQLTHAKGFRPGEREDLVQDLTLRLLERLEAFDPERGSFYCFALVVLDRAASSMVTSRTISRRGPSTRLSLESPDPLVEGDRTPISRKLVSEIQGNRTGRYSRTDQELRELSLDVQDVLQDQPPGVRFVAEGLTHHSRRELARCTGIPRIKICDLARELEAALDEAGLKNPEN